MSTHYIHLAAQLTRIYPRFSDIRPLLPVVSLVVHPVQTESFVSNAVPASCDTAITPACLQAIYGIPATLATQPTNQLGVSGFLQQFANQADLTVSAEHPHALYTSQLICNQTFLKQLRRDLSSNTSFGLQTLDGGQNLQDPSQAGVEAVGFPIFSSTEDRPKNTSQNLDIQYTVGVASGVPVTFISVGNDNKDSVFGFLDLINFLVGLDVPPQVLTTSYGADEFGIAPNLVQYVSVTMRGVSRLTNTIYTEPFAMRTLSSAHGEPLSSLRLATAASPVHRLRAVPSSCQHSPPAAPCKPSFQFPATYLNVRLHFQPNLRRRHASRYHRGSRQRNGGRLLRGRVLQRVLYTLLPAGRRRRIPRRGRGHRRREQV